MFRFSLLALLLFTAVVGLGCAALVYATALVAKTTLFAVVLVLSSALVAVLYSARPLRVFAGGFAVCGWVYMSFTFLGFPNNWSGEFTTVRTWLVTDDALRWLDHQLHGSFATRAAESIGDGTLLELSDEEAWMYYMHGNPDLGAFAIIGHALWSLLLGLFGGGLALFLARRREAEAAATLRK